MTSLLHFNKLLQIPFIILNKNYSISYKQLIEWFLFRGGEYPVVSEIVSLFNEKACSIQGGDIEYIPSKEWLNIYWPADGFVFIKLLSEDNLLKFYQEAKGIISENLKKSGISVQESLLDNAISLNFELIKRPFVTENKKIELEYNIPDFYQAALIGKDVPLKNGRFSYEILRSKDTWNTWPDWYREVVWFGAKKGNYLYSF